VRNKITVVQGHIRVNSIWVARTSAAFLVLEADLSSKYPLTMGITDVAGHTVHLYADRHTMFRGPGDAPTTIRLPARTRGWQVLTETAKYELRIVAWKRARPGRLLYWQLSAGPDSEPGPDPRQDGGTDPQ
jgi:hypothetical protein